MWLSRARYDAIDKWREGSPELVIEVRSASNTKQEMDDKAMTTLAGGAVEFWIVDPESVAVYTRASVIHAYHSKNRAIPLPMCAGQVYPKG